jgi:hypothetical protein
MGGLRDRWMNIFIEKKKREEQSFNKQQIFFFNPCFKKRKEKLYKRSRKKNLGLVS